jgi:N-sulfoglucosamine sulfohydrolase
MKRMLFQQYKVLRRSGLYLLVIQILFLLLFNSCIRKSKKRPNILFAIADDQGYPHASAYGCRFVRTPGFDRVAENGVLFKNVYCAIPQCSPNRASILTGKYLWRNEEAGTHASLFPSHLNIFTDIFLDNGYLMGFTGKGWAPGLIDTVNRKNNKNLIGKEYIAEDESVFWVQFKKFISEWDKEKPFFFWYGSFDPHRTYTEGSGLASGKKMEDVDVPPYLPDNEIVRSDFLDYGLKIDRFDVNLVKIIEILEEIGELENTLIIVTSDNGLPFSRAKGNAYDAGVKVPMAICWGDRIKGGQVIEDLISHVDLAPTMLEAAGLNGLKEIDGKSFLEILLTNSNAKRKPFRDAVFYGRERATSARPDNVGYPVRTIRTQRYELVWNMKPERYPVGNRLDESEDLAVKAEIIRMKDNDQHSMKIYRDAFDFRPEFELHDMKIDPFGLINQVDEPQYREVLDSLFRILKEKLYKDGDPRLHDRGDIWESYPRFMSIRNFGGEHPAYRGVYNEHYVQPGQRIPGYLFDSPDYQNFYDKAGINKDEYIKRMLSKGVKIY